MKKSRSLDVLRSAAQPLVPARVQPFDPLAMEDCYRKIGVYGDRSCPRLAEVIHCHSCEVLAGTAQRLLQGPVLPDYVSELTTLLARPLDASRTADRSFVLFAVGDERLALPTRDVAEVSVVVRPPRRVPHRANGAFAGLLNLHGQLELCFWVERLLNTGGARALSAAPGTGYALVLSHAGQRWVLLIDRVEGVHRMCSDELLPAPPRSARKERPLVAGLVQNQEALYALLDVSMLCASLAEGLQ